MNADFDPLTLSPSTTLWREATDDVEIGYSSMYLLPLLGISLAMTLVSASVAFRWPDDRDIGSYAALAGCIGAVLFAIVTGKLVWMLLVRKRAVVFITRYGIRDLRIANQFVLWESVVEVCPCKRHGRRVVALKVTPALRAQLSLQRAKESDFSASSGLRGDSIIIDPSGLTTEFDALLRACQAHCRGARTATQQYEGGFARQS